MSRTGQWCDGDAQHTPGPGTSRTAGGSSAPTTPARKTVAGPETHDAKKKVNKTRNVVQVIECSEKAKSTKLLFLNMRKEACINSIAQPVK